jgi:hypothetical protein
LLTENGLKSLLAAAWAAFFSCASWAALGSTPANLGPQAAAAQTSAASTGQATYTVLRQLLDSGTTVNQYVDGRGVVFAVTWSGPFLPDLKEILGPYFQTMTAQAANGRARQQHSRLMVREADLVVVSTGRMGAFEGRAWLTSKLPAAFDTKDLR